MTDNEIIKALECCRDCKCKECPCYNKETDGCKEIDEQDILDLINRQKKTIEIADKMVESLKAEVKRLQKKREAKCGTCYYSKPTTFDKSKCYVECTNQEHIEKFCRFRKISLKRQRTTPACKNYKEMVGDDNA